MRIRPYTRERKTTETGRRNMQNEKYVEQKLIKAVKQRGGLALKFTSPGYDGVPDRILLFGGGVLAFAELKAPGKKPRKLQVRRIEKFRSLGFKVYVIDNTEMIEEVLDEILSA